MRQCPDGGCSSVDRSKLLVFLELGCATCENAPVHLLLVTQIAVRGAQTEACREGALGRPCGPQSSKARCVYTRVGRLAIYTAFLRLPPDF